MPQIDYSAKLLDMEGIEIKDVVQKSSHIELEVQDAPDRACVSAMPYDHK